VGLEIGGPLAADSGWIKMSKKVR